MKKILSLLMLGMICIAFQDCTEDSLSPVEKQQVQFQIGITSDDESNGRTQNQLPDGAIVRISINNHNGENVITDLSIPILKFGDSYFTEPLELPLGRFFVVDFIILKESEVLFVTPKRNSPLAGLVKHPLPYSFSISRNKVSNVPVQVVDVSSQAPESFGYASFGIEIIYPLQISVFTLTENGPSLSKALLSLIKGADTLYTYPLGAKVNLIPFKGEIDGMYTLVISKSGYSDYKRNFTYNDLMIELNGKPLAITLMPIAECLEFTRNGGDLTVTFELDFHSFNELIVDWDDGEIDTITSANRTQVTHSYSKDNFGTYIKLCGELHKIKEFTALSGIGDTYFTEYLPNLESFTLNDATVFDMVMVGNTKLKRLDVAGVHSMGFVIPDDHQLQYVDFQRASTFHSESFEIAITSIYNNAIKNKIRDGYLDVRNMTLHGYSDDPVVPFIPPAEIIFLMDELSESHGWTVQY